MEYRTDGAAVECLKCGAKFGGMSMCPWCGIRLVPLPDAAPIAVAFYAEISSSDGRFFPLPEWDLWVETIKQREESAKRGGYD